MAGSFTDKGSGPGTAGNRPVPTIEGTATEVAVEPEAEEAAAKDDVAAKATDEAATPEDDGDAAGTTAQLEPPEPMPQPARGSAVRSFLSHLTAGLLGGLVGAGALAIAWGFLPESEPPQMPDLTALEDRIATLEAAPPSSDNAAALAQLEARLTELENRKPETPPELSALADRVAQLEATLKAMADAANDGGSVADAAAISQQINEAETRLDAKIDKALADAKAANDAALDALKTEIARIDAKLKALAEAELGSGDASKLVPEITALDERLDKIESALPALFAAVDKEAEDTRAATLAIAFANLRAAVDDGRPYVAELGILAALSPGAGDLGGLLDYEDTGIPTLPELTRAFEQARDVALAAPASDGEASILDRLTASAESLVTIKRVDAEAEGDTSDAVLARAAAQLDEGNLAEAVKEVETLHGAPRAAFDGWLDQAHARLGANATLQKLQNILLVSLGGSGAPDQTDEQD